jgi:hypothetical protein
MKIPLEYVLKIGRILVDIGGASPRILEAHSDFIHYLSKEETSFGHEYRFMGKLGSGGKFYANYSGWQVSCYHEDDTSIRRELIVKINEKLSVLYSEFETLEMEK